MIKVVLLGSGNVAYHLALALKSAKHVELIQRYSIIYTLLFVLCQPKIKSIANFLSSISSAVKPLSFLGLT